jgi:hypothetical protein
MRSEAIRQLEPKHPVQVPTDADRQRYYGLFAPEQGADPTPETIASRVAHLRRSLLFLHDPNFGGEVNTEESQS